jgi:hypothetical protein
MRGHNPPENPKSSALALTVGVAGRGRRRHASESVRRAPPFGIGPVLLREEIGGTAKASGKVVVQLLKTSRFSPS